MKSVLSRAAWSLASLVLVMMAPVHLAAADWLPKHFVVADESTSPDGRFGLIIPGRDTLSDVNDTEDAVNYLADLKAHRLLGKIRGAGYTQGENHAGLETYWAPDSSRVLVNYSARFGFGSLIVMEPHEKDFAQVKIDKVVQDALSAVIAKQTHDKSPDCFGELFCRWLPGGQLSVRALGENNPKQLDIIKTHYAFFEGTYDFSTKKWLATASRPLAATEQYDNLEALFQKGDSSQTYNSEDDRATALDDELNSVYGALRSILPAARFAEIKKEQIAWLKTRDAAASTKAKGDLLEARIRALRELAW